MQSDKYFLNEYSRGVLIVRKDYLPLMVYYGKDTLSYWVTTPPAKNGELASTFEKWFHEDFVEIVSHVVKKRDLWLGWDQKKPSDAGRGFGWYLPISVILELHKMWVEENVPMVFDLLRPVDRIYGTALSKKDVILIIEQYLYDNKSSKT